MERHEIQKENQFPFNEKINIIGGSYEAAEKYLISLMIHNSMHVVWCGVLTRVKYMK